MKVFSFSLILVLVFKLNSFGISINDSTSTALLLIDIQNFYFPGDGPGLFNAEQAGLNAKEVLGIFRQKKQMVVHVQHKAKKEFEIHNNVKPLPDEKVITKEEVNSFSNTDLFNYLKSNNIKRLVIIGMQTHMCVEAAVRAGFDLGFECIIIEDACATRDLKFKDKTINAVDVHLSTLTTFTNGGYGKVIDLEEFLSNPDKYIFQKD
jgi:nicotinamidase-related amidase